MWKCPLHSQERVVFVCLDANCRENSRLLCSDCAIFSSLHKDHLSSIVNIEELLSTSDASTFLKFIRNTTTRNTHPDQQTEQQQTPNYSTNRIPQIQLTKAQVNLFFDLLASRISEELASTRFKVLQLTDLQENLTQQTSSQFNQLHTRLRSLLEDSHDPAFEQQQLSTEKQPYPSHRRNPSLLNLDCSSSSSSSSSNKNNNNNLYGCLNSSEDLCEESAMNQIVEAQPMNQFNFYSEISSEISLELEHFLESQTQITKESNLLSLQSLKSCKLHLSEFESDLLSFLATSTTIPTASPRHDQASNSPLVISNYLYNNFSQELNSDRIKLLAPADFYGNIGYTNCIAITNPEELPLLRKVSTSICFEAEAVAAASTASSILTQTNHVTAPATPQRPFFFSILQDNKNLFDSDAIKIAEGIERINYISNIHIDFDDNNLSDAGYSSIFRSLSNFESLEHIDLRFNRNFKFTAQSAHLLADLLKKNKSSLRVLCLTLRSLRTTNDDTPTYQQQNTTTLSDSFDLTSSSSSISRSSFSTTPQNPWQQLQHRSIPPIEEGPSTEEIFEIIISSIANLDTLEVLYLDFSDNNLSGDISALPQVLCMPRLTTAHLVLNHTSISAQTAIDVIQNGLKSHPSPFNHMKLFLKDNSYTFQQQRIISGKYQKIKASNKNFDLFY